VTTTIAEDEPATYTKLLANHAFMGLVAVQLANVLGQSLQIFALSVLIYAQTGSAFWSSAAFAAGFLPQLIGGALLTSLADRWPARPLIAFGAALRAASAALLAFTHVAPIVAISVVAAVAVISPVPSAAQSALVARLLTGELYILGRSTFNVLSSGGQLAGLSLGGAVVAGLGPRPRSRSRPEFS
jgi:MFS family permease